MAEFLDRCALCLADHDGPGIFYESSHSPVWHGDHYRTSFNYHQ